MPPTPLTPLTHRPQTLKQAKKAYRKAGATVRLSESEKAVLERRAVLQERADRIKEREARRKANLKKKEERVQREREARHRMGMPTPPAKEGIQVGPSQLHLSDFVYAGVKRKWDDDGEEERKSGMRKEGDLVVQEQEMSPMEPPPSRQPLRPLSANANSQPPTPPQGLKANLPKVRDFALLEKPVVPKGTPGPSRTPPIQPKEVLEPPRNVLQKSQRTTQIQNRIGPPTSLPPLRRPSGPKPAGSTSPQEPPEKIDARYTSTRNPPPNQIKQTISIPQPPAKPPSIPEDSISDFFVSNTQIQRELSPPPTPPAKKTPTPLPTPAHPPTPPPFSNPPFADPETASLLALISTQDLDFSDTLTQHQPTRCPTTDPSPDEDEDFPDDELEDIVLEFEFDSPVKSSTATTTPEHEQQPKPPPQDPSSQKCIGEAQQYSSDYDDDDGSHHNSDKIYHTEVQEAELQHTLLKPHQKDLLLCREAQRTAAAAEYDAFELSTQDLMELET